MSRRDERLPHDLDAEIRLLEDEVYAHYGVDRIGEEHVVVDTAAGHHDVRLQVFGPEPTPTQPPVLLLHGIGSWQVLAAPLLPHLADRRVYAVDWPGHGLSGPAQLKRDQNLRAFAVAIFDALASGLGLAQVDLIGHSLGAQFSVYAALDLGSLVRRLVLLGAPGGIVPGTKPAALMTVFSIPAIGPRVLGIKGSDAQFVRVNEGFALGKGAFDGTPAAMATACRLMTSRPGNTESVHSYFQALVRGNRIRGDVTPSDAELGSLRQPVLCVWGDADTFNTPANAARGLVAFRDLHLLHLPGAGHAPWLDQPDAAGVAVAAHLAAQPSVEVPVGGVL